MNLNINSLKQSCELLCKNVENSEVLTMCGPEEVYHVFPTAQ